MIKMNLTFKEHDADVKEMSLTIIMTLLIIKDIDFKGAIGVVLYPLIETDSKRY